jgi:hypothetical protein
MKRSSKDLAAQIFVGLHRGPFPRLPHSWSKSRPSVQQGFAANDQESDKGLFAISVPVHSASGEPAAALGVAYPIGFLDSSLRTSLLRTLRLYAHEIGYVGVELSTEAERHMMSQRS